MNPERRTKGSKVRILSRSQSQKHLSELSVGAIGRISRRIASVFLVVGAVGRTRPLAPESSQRHFTPEASFRANTRGIPPTSPGQTGATVPGRLHHS